MENKFQIASKKERELMQRLLNSNSSVSQIEFTPIDGYDRYDGSFYSTTVGDKVYFETKVRSTTSKQFSKTGIELSKYEYLQSLNKPAMLFVFFSDNKVMVHRFNDNTKYTKASIQAPKQSCGNREIVTKYMIDVPIIDKEIYNIPN